MSHDYTTVAYMSNRFDDNQRDMISVFLLFISLLYD